MGRKLSLKARVFPVFTDEAQFKEMYILCLTDSRGLFY